MTLILFIGSFRIRQGREHVPPLRTLAAQRRRKSAEKHQTPAAFDDHDEIKSRLKLPGDRGAAAATQDSRDEETERFPLDISSR